MANKKITELTDLPSPAGADIMAIVDDVAGTPTTKKVTATNLMTLAPVQSVAGQTGTVTLSNTDISGLGTAATSASTDFSPAFFTIVSETTTARTLSNSDNGKVIVCSNSAQITVTIPSGLTSGFGCTIVQNGTGVVSIEGSGATVSGFGDKTATAGQYGSINVYNVGTNAYVLEGDTQSPPFGNTYSVDFDGTNDYVALSGLSTCYAFSCWIKPDSTITSSAGTSGNLLGQNATSWFGGLGGDLTGDFTDELITIRPSSQTGFAYTSNTDNIPSTSWTHIAFRWEASNSSTNPGNAGYDIFKNGTKVGNAAGTSPITSPIVFSTGLIGARQTSSYFFNGKIDEVAFWTSTVSESDVATMYNSGTPGDLSSLSPFGWWRMGDNDGGTGTTITDQGSGGNDGTLTNGPTFSTDVP
jgi:hypothetical protein